MKIAVIGSGISGMSSAYFLCNEHDVTVFEKNNYIGGHTNTISVKEKDQTVSFDTGFMVFNEVTYPYFCKLLKEIDVTPMDTDMSFSVRHNESNLEYNGSNLDGLFAQRKNIFNIPFISMLLKINKFNEMWKVVLEDNTYASMTVREFVEKEKLGEKFLYQYLVPMSSAVWSTPQDKILSFPIRTLMRFFYNHGFLGLHTQHQWKTIPQGSENYKIKLIKKFQEKIKINDEAIKVRHNENDVTVITKSGEYTFDKVIMACHGIDALKLLENPTPDESRLLKNFNYQKNLATIHTDETVMPKLKKNWSSWNYVSRKNKRGLEEQYTVYYMNRLQKMKTNIDYFVSIEGSEFVDPKKIIQQIEYEHPLFDLNAVNAQSELHLLQDPKKQINYCGAYFRYGFHEDGLLSSVQLCERILNRKILA